MPGFRARPFVLLGAGDETDVARRQPPGRPSRGLLLTYADEVSEIVFNLGAPGEARPAGRAAGRRPLADEPSWRAYAVC